MTSICCKYYVQNDPSDQDGNGINLFVLTKKFLPHVPVRLKDVLADFPLALDGVFKYHLRFLTVINGNPAYTAWVDVLNEEAVLPLVAPGMISIKAIQLPNNVHAKIKKARSAIQREYIPEEDKKEVTEEKREEEQPEENEILEDETPEAKQQKIDEIFDLDPIEPSREECKSPEDVQYPKEAKTGKPGLDSKSQDVVLNWTNDEEKKESNEKIPESREKILKPKLEPLAVRIEKITNQIHDQWEKEEKDQEEYHEAYELYEEKIRNWVGTSGNKNNIRTLLCTVHNILWSGCKWTPVSMSELISPSGVKKYYRKAITMLNPDKVQGMQDQHIKYIADRVFNGINDAYNEFRKAES